MSGHPGEGGDSVSTKGRQRPRETMAGQIGSSSTIGEPVGEDSSHRRGVIFVCLFVCFALSYFLFAEIRAVTLFLSKIFTTF